jgi:hypothetical protein
MYSLMMAYGNPKLVHEAEFCTNKMLLLTGTVVGLYGFRKVLNALSVLFRLQAEQPRRRSCLCGTAICTIR